MGGLPGRTHLTLAYGLRNDGNKFELYRTAHHELGHVLGLYHEHQHWDRDDYLELDYPGGWASVAQLFKSEDFDGLFNAFCALFNNDKLKHYFTIPLPTIVVRWTTIKTGWFSIDIPIFIIKIVDTPLFKLADGEGGFDYNSIMLYGGDVIKIKQPFDGFVPRWKSGFYGDTSKIEKIPRQFCCR